MTEPPLDLSAAACEEAAGGGEALAEALEDAAMGDGSVSSGAAASDVRLLSARIRALSAALNAERTVPLDDRGLPILEPGHPGDLMAIAVKTLEAIAAVRLVHGYDRSAELDHDLRAVADTTADALRFWRHGILPASVTH